MQGVKVEDGEGRSDGSCSLDLQIGTVLIYGYSEIPSLVVVPGIAIVILRLLVLGYSWSGCWCWAIAGQEAAQRGSEGRRLPLEA